MADDLEQNLQDYLATTGRAAAGLIPLVGGVLAELIGAAIPRQRTDRVVAYLRTLEARLVQLEIDPRKAFADAERADLIEEGAFQAARATTQERVQRIAELVSNGLSSPDANIVRRKRLAALLGEIDDDEVLVLNAYGQAYGGDVESAWDKVERPDPPHMQSTVDEFDAAKLYDAGRDRLLRLGLLEKRYRSPRRGEERKFDERSGDFDHNVEISYLGRMLLRDIGMPSPYDVDD